MRDLSETECGGGPWKAEAKQRERGQTSAMHDTQHLSLSILHCLIQSLSHIDTLGSHSWQSNTKHTWPPDSPSLFSASPCLTQRARLVCVISLHTRRRRLTAHSNAFSRTLCKQSTLMYVPRNEHQAGKSEDRGSPCQSMQRVGSPIGTLSRARARTRFAGNCLGNAQGSGRVKPSAALVKKHSK